MLQTIRDRAHGIMAWVILISIAVPFALWGIQNYLDVGKEKPVATVGDKELFERDVNRAVEQALSGLTGLSDEDEKTVRRQALEQLIHEHLLRSEVRRLRLSIGDDELRGLIQSLPYFQTEGKFDKEKYKLAVASKGMNPNALAAQIREAQAMEQLQSSIAKTAQATPYDVDQFLRLKNQKRTIDYVLVPVAKESTATPSPQAVKDYYRDHEAQFQTAERVAAQYVELDIEQVANQLQAGQEELKAYYEEQKASYTTQERRKVSHILIAVGPGADEAAYAKALDKAKQAAARIEKGDDFSLVAKENSDDKLTAGKGGDLGFIARGQMDKNFESAAFQLKAGEVSVPVKSSFGYHLIKITELSPSKTKSFDEVKDELRKSFQRNAAEKRFYELGEKLSQAGFEHSDSLDAAAEAIGGKVQETDLFTRDAGAGIASEATFRNAAFNREVLDGHNSDAVELGTGKVVVLRAKNYIQAAPRPLEEVRPQIEALLRHDAAKAAAKAKAQSVFDRIQRGESLAEAAKAAGLTVSTMKAFGRDGSEGPRELQIAAFKMERPAEGQTGKRLTELANGDQAILQLLNVTDGDPAVVSAEEKTKLRETLMRAKGQAEYSSFVQQLREEEKVTVSEAKEP